MMDLHTAMLHERNILVDNKEEEEEFFTVTLFATHQA